MIAATKLVLAGRYQMRESMRVGQMRQEHSGQSPSAHESAETHRGAPALTFREVTFDEVGRVADPHYHRARAFVVWVASPALVGIFPIAPQGVSDLEPALTLYLRLCQPSGTRLLYCDLRGFGLDNATFESMLHSSSIRRAAFETRPLRASVVLPDDWTRPWWVGAVELGETIAAPTRAFVDGASAWRWLEAPEHVRHAVDELTAHHAVASTLHADLHVLFRADPALGMQRAARVLGLSLRSIQRALRARGETFADLRNRARAEVALTGLAKTDQKVDAVAASAGFRSRSHFVAWFRKLTGNTPAEFRERHR
jgi:AraC-like DNA-binding protein